MFNNALVDGSFGVTSKIYLAEMTPGGFPIATIAVPASELVTIDPTNPAPSAFFRAVAQLSGNGNFRQRRDRRQPAAGRGDPRRRGAADPPVEPA